MSEKIYGQFDLDTIRELADIINDKELSEITISDGDKQISIKGRKPMPGPGMPPPMGAARPPFGVPPVGMPNGMQPPVPPMQGGSPLEQGVPVAQASGKEVKAPIVGTFYAAPSPDSKPFVSVGDTVKKGDTIYIIESMKVMSEVQSEFDGVVKKILVQSGDPVDFDQTVMVIG